MNIDELASAIRQAFESYWAGRPEISDTEYDALVCQLREAAPDHPLLEEVGAPQVAALGEIRLAAPMISLDKV